MRNTNRVTVAASWAASYGYPTPEELVVGFMFLF